MIRVLDFLFYGFKKFLFEFIIFNSLFWFFIVLSIISYIGYIFVVVIVIKEGKRKKDEKCFIWMNSNVL